MPPDVFVPQKAFILAAGFGTRMRPLTDHIPKPMVEIAGRSLIYRILDKLTAAGVREVIVNTHYHADVLQRHLEVYPQQNFKIHISHEPQILETGGGVVKALPFFGQEPFYVIAGDAFWTDGKVPALVRLAQHWDERRMDILTLMEPLSRMKLTQGVGDYDLLPDGHVRRSKDKTGQMMWTNIRINHPRLYTGAPSGAFSFLPLMDEAEQRGRFFALEHDGLWHHISTPADRDAVEASLTGAARGV